MQHDWPTLISALRAFVRSRISDPDAADDVVSEALERALRGRWEDRGYPYSAWLFSIARSTIVDHYRRQRRRPTVALWGVSMAGPTTARVEAQEALAVLLPRERAALLLRYAGYSATEVAEAWGTSEGAIKSLMHRARQRLD